MDDKIRLCTLNKDFAKGLAIAFVLAASISSSILLQFDSQISANAMLSLSLPILACCTMYAALKTMRFESIATILTSLAFGFSSLFFSYESYSLIAALPYIVLPLLLLPAIYTQNKQKSILLSTGLLAIPIVFIIAFFVIPSSPSMMKTIGQQTFFPIPIQLKLNKELIKAIYNPLQHTQTLFTVTLYHMPLLAAVIGLVKHIRNESPFYVILLAASILLASFENIAGIPPVAWLSISAIIVSIFTAKGTTVILNWINIHPAAKAICFFAFYIDIALCANFYANKLII